MVEAKTAVLRTRPKMEEELELMERESSEHQRTMVQEQMARKAVRAVLEVSRMAITIRVLR